MAAEEAKAPSPGALLAQWTEKAKARGSNPVQLLRDQWAALETTATQLHKAVTGDEREQLHLEAQFKLGKFSAEAAAFVEADAWAHALLDVLTELASGMLANALPGASAAGLLKVALEGAL